VDRSRILIGNTSQPIIYCVFSKNSFIFQSTCLAEAAAPGRVSSELKKYSKRIFFRASYVCFSHIEPFQYYKGSHGKARRKVLRFEQKKFPFMSIKPFSRMERSSGSFIKQRDSMFMGNQVDYGLTEDFINGFRTISSGVDRL
jgi:hypothetical protein